MSDHATLSPSGSERWLACPASVQATVHLRDESSSYAQEGTAAHSLAEMYARRELLGGSAKKFTADLKAWRTLHADKGYDEATMAAHALEYVALLRHLMAGIPQCALLLEQRVNTGIPGSWGTADAVIVSPSIIHVVDYKYGQGVRVDVEDNPQLKLYGLGALDTFGDLLGEVAEVRMTIHQPRLEHSVTTELTTADILAWREVIRPVAASALDGTGPFGPSESACRWCPAAGNCEAQLKWATARDFGTPNTELTDEALAEALEAAPAIQAWLNALQDYALDRLYSGGRPIPGWKVVRNSGRRYITDSDAAIAALEEHGHATDDVSKRKIIGIGDLEKLLGKAGLTKILGPWVDKTPGSPALVRDTDRRLAITPGYDAAEDFGDGDLL